MVRMGLVIAREIICTTEWCIVSTMNHLLLGQFMAGALHTVLDGTVLCCAVLQLYALPI